MSKDLFIELLPTDDTLHFCRAKKLEYDRTLEEREGEYREEENKPLVPLSDISNYIAHCINQTVSECVDSEDSPIPMKEVEFKIKFSMYHGYSFIHNEYGHFEDIYVTPMKGSVEMKVKSDTNE